MTGRRITIWLLVGVLIALIASVGLNVYLFQRSRQDYLDLNRTRLDPLGLAEYPPEATPPGAADKPALVFFGDSRALEWTAPPEAAAWQVVNRGIGAQTTAQVLGRFDQEIAPLRPKIILLEVGINDLKTIPLFPDQKTSIIQQCQANIAEIVRRARALGATVILATIFPTGRVPLQRQLFWSADIPAAVQTVNGYLPTLQSNGVVIFDAAQVLADANGGLRAEYSRDELHLNAAGYEALNQALGPLLLKLAQ